MTCEVAESRVILLVGFAKFRVTRSSPESRCRTPSGRYCCGPYIAPHYVGLFLLLRYISHCAVMGVNACQSRIYYVLPPAIQLALAYG
jgi:hypothetical protein